MKSIRKALKCIAIVALVAIAFAIACCILLFVAIVFALFTAGDWFCDRLHDLCIETRAFCKETLP